MTELFMTEFVDAFGAFLSASFVGIYTIFVAPVWTMFLGWFGLTP